MNIGDVWAALRIDSSQTEKDAAQAGKKGGEAAAKSMGASLKKGMALVGGAISGALTVALVGRFAALERAQAEFRRETGATAAEAERAGRAINDMAGRNLQSIEEIGATLTKVHTDLGLTGEEAERTAEAFLRFGRATGQEASGAVLAFDDILDAWNLTAADAQGIMDQLVASHQQYGGSIEDNQRNLAQLAPSLKAMNVSTDEAVGLLNLFAASGLEASKTQLAFNSAVSKLPPGTTLMDYLETLQAIEDPTERAQEAIRVFGSRAGAGLANALGPGKGAIEDYIITAEEVPGATEAAADASMTMVDRLKQAFSGFVSGTVDLLGPAGPLLTAVGSLGQLFAPAIGRAFRAALPQAKLAIAAAGAAAGAVYSAAAAGGSMLMDAIAGAWAALGRPGSKVITAARATGRAAAVAAAAGAATIVLALPLVLTGDSPNLPKSIEERVASIRALITELQKLDASATIPNSTVKAADAIRGLEQVIVALEAGNTELADAILQGRMSLEELGTTAETTTRTLDGLDWSKVTEAAGQMQAAVTDTVDVVQRRGPLIGIAWRENIQTALAEVRAGHRDIVANARTAVVDMRERIKNGKAGIIEQFRDLAWQSKNPFAETNYADWLARKHEQAMNRSETKAKQGKHGVAAQWRQLAYEIRQEMLTLPGVAAEITRRILASLAVIKAAIASTPLNIVPGLGGLGDFIPGRASGGPVQAGHPYIVGENRRPELFVPESNGYVFPDVNGAGGMSGHIVVEVRDPDGGLARAGIGTDSLAQRLSDAIGAAADTAHIGYRTPRGAF